MPENKARFVSKGRPYKMPTNLEKFKDLKATEVLIFLDHIENPTKTLEDIASEWNISRSTASRYIRKVEDSEFMSDCKAGLNKMRGLLLASIEGNLLERNPLVTIAFAKGTGLWVERTIQETPKSIEETRSKLRETLNRLYPNRITGFEPEPIPVPEPKSELQEEPEIVKPELKKEEKEGVDCETFHKE